MIFQNFQIQKSFFYKNGQNQGIAFEDIPLPVAAASYLRPEYRNCKFEPYTRSSSIYDDGSLGYYPSVSLFKGGSVTLNFGPEFKYPPNDIEENWKPLCDRYDEIQIEETLNDILNEVSFEDNKDNNKQKYYIALSYDSKHNDTTTNEDNNDNVPIKKRKITNVNRTNNIDEINDKKRKFSIDDNKNIKPEFNTITKIPKIKSLESNNRSNIINNKSMENDNLQERRLPIIANSVGKSNNIDGNNDIMRNDINVNNKIYNPKLFELSNMETEVSNTIESSAQTNQNNNNILCNPESHMEKSNFINNNENKIDNSFAKMDSAIFINQ